MRSHRLVALQLFAAASLWGCSCFQSVLERQCDSKTPCGSGWLCVAGECVPPGAGGGVGGGGVGGSGGVGGGIGGGGGIGSGGGDPQLKKLESINGTLERIERGIEKLGSGGESKRPAVK